MMTTIAKTFDFDAAHRLWQTPTDHKCHRLHGHTYRVEVRVRGEPGGRNGMVIDYADLARAWGAVHQYLDHYLLLNRDDPAAAALQAIGEPLRVFPWEPTTENLAEYIREMLANFSLEVRPDKDTLQNFSLGGLSLSVRVYESSTTYAEVGRT